MKKILAGSLLALPLTACTPYTIRIGQPASIQCDASAVRWAWTDDSHQYTVSSDECTLMRAGYEHLFPFDPSRLVRGAGAFDNR